ncbi:MAG: AraC family transcriptional regulator [Bacteroidota bacterium]
MRSIAHFTTINDLHTATGFPMRTRYPEIHAWSTTEAYVGLRQYMPPYRQSFYQLSISSHQAGTTLTVDGHQTADKQNVAISVAPGQVISWLLGKPTPGYIVLFTEALLAPLPYFVDRHFPFLLQQQAGAFVLADGPATELIHAAAEIVRIQDEERSDRLELLRALVLALLWRFADHLPADGRPTPGPALVHRFRNALEQHYLAHWRVREYAAYLHVSPGHLTATVSAATGLSPKEHCNRRLLLEAQRMLRYTEATITEIAFQLGFNEPAHFTRFFRRATGESPTSFLAKR